MSSPVHSSGSHQRSGPSASAITPARQLVQTDIGVLAMARWFPAGDSAVAAPAGAHATAAPLIVLLHGMFGNTDVWAATALNLARAGLEVLAFDLPGHGERRTRMASPEDTVQALAQALHTVANRPLVLVGQSFGTLIATRLMSLLSASRNAGTTQDEHAACSASDVRPQFSPAVSAGAAHPDSRPVGVSSSADVASGSPPVVGLVLLSPVGLGPDVNRDFLLNVMSAAERADVAALERAFAQLTVRHYRASHAYMQRLCQRIADASEQLYTFIDATVDITGSQRVDLIGDLAAACVPVTVVHGREDAVLPWQQVLNAPPQVALHLPAQVGHMPHWEANPLVCTLIGRAAGLR